jgi:hypothetical protein
VSDNARIRTMAPGVTAEMVAEQVHIFYDPAAGSASIAFQARESLFVSNAYEPLNGAFNVLQVNLADIETRLFAPVGTIDPVTGADLSKISPAGVDLILKAAYDTLFNEQSALIAAAATQQQVEQS